MTVPLLAPGAALKEHFVIDYPEQSLDEGHWCMGIVLTHPQDAILAGSAPLTNYIAQVNEQVLVARAGTPVGPESRAASGGSVGSGGSAAGGSDCPGPMALKSKIYLLDGYNPFGKPRNVEVRIGTPPLYDDVVLPSNWTLDIWPGLGPYVVTPSVKDSIQVELASATAEHGQSAHVPLTLWDIDEDKMIGGAVIDASVDCFAPQAVENIHAEWLDFPGDDWGEHNVLVEWSHVTLDENSDPESLSHYEVYRADGGGTETLVDRVIIDAEPETAGFQWYDYVITAPCTDYTYRVRAVDLAGNVGAFSDEAVLQCEVAGLPGDESDGSGDESPWNGLERSRAYPNPFASGTDIEFQTVQEAAVEVAIFDATGKRVRLLSDETRGVGLHRVHWDGRDESGRETASGIYFYRVRGEGIAEMRKIVRSR
ncbi:MAG: T9SS type A sorting domain-containing protein [Candidatus Eisenbacteria bacterium]